MAQTTITRRRGLALLGGAAVAGLAAGALAVYVNRGGGGNGAELASAGCDDAAKAAARVAETIKGDLAAFRVADKHEALNGLAFKAPDGSDSGIGALGGKTVLLNLWATWCGPCRAEMPALDRLQAELGNDLFEVVAVNIDVGAPERAKEFLTEIGVSNLAFYADSTSKIFNDLKRRGLALGLPVTLLLDRHGCMIGGLQGPAEWDSPDAKALVRAALDV